jgi:hypothetical protein
MGLDVSHGAFSASYSSFSRLRQWVCAATGGSYPPHEDETLPWDMWVVGPGYDSHTHPGLFEFLSHSDCDGEISPDMCARVADELEALLPKAVAMGWKASGYIEACGGYEAVLLAFIKGCRAAHAANEPLEFY